MIVRSMGLRARLLACAFAAVAATPAHSTPAPSPTVADIVQARSIDSISISPDGSRVAYRLLTPSLGDNRTTLQWRSAPLAGDAAPTALGGPGEPLWMPIYDVPEDGVSQWAPDSRSLLVQWVEPVGIQVHLLGPGGQGRALTSDPADVTGFALSSDGRSLTYRTRDARAEIDRAQAEEGLRGVRIERSVMRQGMRLTGNFQIGDRVTTMREVMGVGIEAHAGEARDHSVTIDLGAAGEGAAAPRRREYLLAPGVYRTGQTERDMSGVEGVLTFRKGGLAVRLNPLGAVNRLGRQDFEIVVRRPDGTETPCTLDVCRGETSALRQVMINDVTGEVVILRQHDNQSTLTAWNPRTDKTRAIYRGGALLNGGSLWSASLACSAAGRYLLCVEAGPARPQRLVRIDMTSGEVRALDDPNAQLAAKAYGPTRFMTWRDAKGREGHGVLILPRGGGRDLPLVITSYTCGGFLSGSSSNLTPEPPLAEAGVAVLCMSGPASSAFEEKDADGRPIVASAHKAFVETAAAAIDQLAREGLIDRRRVGIAGHSFSATSSAYAVSHTNLFAAASLEGTIMDPQTYWMHSGGPSYLAAMNLPTPDAPGADAIFRETAPALNAEKIRAALLWQPPELEWTLALQTHQYVLGAGGVSELYVFPDEGHMVGRQPRHQLHRAERSVDWFRFWLQGYEDPAPEKAGEYAEWRKARQRQCEKLPAAGAPIYCEGLTEVRP